MAVSKLATDHEVTALAREAGPGGNTDLPGLIVIVVGDSVLGARLDALQLVLEDQVDHAGDRIGSPGGGRAARDHFGTLHQGGGYQAKVDRAIYRSSHMSTAVHQYQRAHATDTSQVCLGLPGTVARRVAGGLGAG